MEPLLRRVASHEIVTTMPLDEVVSTILRIVGRVSLLGKVTAVCLNSEQRGTTKTNHGEAVLKPEHGLVGDAHAGNWNRQVSLLAEESIQRAKASGVEVVSENHGENFTTSGMDLLHLPVGTKLAIGDQAILEITQIGKPVHDSPIFAEVKNHILPHEGVFAKVVRGGKVKVGDAIEVDRELV